MSRMDDSRFPNSTRSPLGFRVLIATTTSLQMESATISFVVVFAVEVNVTNIANWFSKAAGNSSILL